MQGTRAPLIFTANIICKHVFVLIFVSFGLFRHSNKFLFKCWVYCIRCRVPSIFKEYALRKLHYSKSDCASSVRGMQFKCCHMRINAKSAYCANGAFGLYYSMRGHRKRVWNIPDIRLQIVCLSSWSYWHGKGLPTIQLAKLHVLTHNKNSERNVFACVHKL